ncbi:MAG: acetyl-CoA carboxylase biotin carboxylase subunit [Defluviitaleaceae bacterium]|nr:acetyl-CoA carboxylase biotin carboxylase subunit [Defluviitaleaceae bacterium]
MFSKILIANRGEIAIRVIRACKEMGINTVAVYSEADRDALHVSLAEESCCIGKATSAESYLNMNNIISAAKAFGAEAIHPGYGFLSENPAFSNLCAKHEITFIGPSGAVIAQMGDKDMARKTMAAAGVPIIPGCELVENLAHAKTEAERIGFPLLIKARAGGGGRGIRLVNAASELENQYNLATNEALSAFKDGSVYMEKYLTGVKHIEAQILADNFGNVVCLGERDCSMQRRNQKLVEESPSPVVTDEMRKRFSDMAIQAAKAVDYRGAGTIECLYDQKSGEFYFMEMNTRLQVEHPVTEFVTGVDLVKWQIRIAAGLPLKFKQEDIKLDGFAIECRINAEDANFKPSCGKITMLHVPGGPLVRFDSAIYSGYSIPPFYDSMIGKLIVASRSSRKGAIRKMKAALAELVIEGVANNSELQMDIMNYEEFAEGGYTTASLEQMLSND